MNVTAYPPSEVVDDMAVDDCKRRQQAECHNTSCLCCDGTGTHTICGGIYDRYMYYCQPCEATGFFESEVVL